MEIVSLSLFAFRNFSQKRVTFDKNLTVIIGPNGSGKSNILEAIAYLSGVRPARVETDLDHIKFGQNEAKIEAVVANPPEQKTLTINFASYDSQVRKAYFVDSIKKKLSDFVTSLAIIVFHPQDLELVTGSPAERRHHLDSLLSSLDRTYHRSITAYSQIITRRNKILFRIAEGKSKPTELDFWDSRLLAHGQYLSRMREEFIEYLNFVEKTMPVSLAGGLAWQLKQSLLSAEKLLKNRGRDIEAGVTLSGPHRDDFRFMLGGRDLYFFGSRGEQRMAVLALKLAELEYFQMKTGTRPILALDDIFSELDWEHREAVLGAVGKQQTIITAAEEESVPKKLLTKAKVISL